MKLKTNKIRVSRTPKFLGFALKFFCTCVSMSVITMSMSCRTRVQNWHRVWKIFSGLKKILKPHKILYLFDSLQLIGSLFEKLVKNISLAWETGELPWLPFRGVNEFLTCFQRCTGRKRGEREQKRSESNGEKRWRVYKTKVRLKRFWINLTLGQSVLL